MPDKVNVMSWNQNQTNYLQIETKPKRIVWLLSTLSWKHYINN